MINDGLIEKLIAKAPEKYKGQAKTALDKLAMLSAGAVQSLGEDLVAMLVKGNKRGALALLVPFMSDEELEAGVIDDEVALGVMNQQNHNAINQQDDFVSWLIVAMLNIGAALL